MNKIYILLFSFSVIFYACSASTDTRYSEAKEEIESKKEHEQKSKIIEDFDFTPFKTDLDIQKKELILPSTTRSDVWYGYDETEPDTGSNSGKKIIDKIPGYRVLVLSTDNLEEANNMRSEIYFSNTQREVYVVFDPPFYKVMIGDFTEYTEARDLSFKMGQLGYSESRVVNETINVFEK